MKLDNNEIKGRLTLWFFAAVRAQSELAMAIKAKNAMKLSEKKPFYSGEIIKSHIHWIPNYGELSFMYESHMMLAIVIINQIFSTGNEDKGKVSKNCGKNFVEPYMELVINEVLSDKKEEFQKFKSLIINARNEMIGHADANAYDLVHERWYTRTNDITKSIEKIDANLFYYYCSKLKEGILAIKAKIKEN